MKATEGSADPKVTIGKNKGEAVKQAACGADNGCVDNPLTLEEKTPAILKRICT